MASKLVLFALVACATPGPAVWHCTQTATCNGQEIVQRFDVCTADIDSVGQSYVDWCGDLWTFLCQQGDCRLRCEEGEVCGGDAGP